MLRRLTERLTRGTGPSVAGLPKISAAFPILVTPSAGSALPGTRSMENVDPVLMGLVKDSGSGSVVWDIGANVGLFAFAAASLAGPGGQVVAMEPDAWLVQLLRRSAKMQPAARPR